MFWCGVDFPGLNRLKESRVYFSSMFFLPELICAGFPVGFGVIVFFLSLIFSPLLSFLLLFFFFFFCSVVELSFFRYFFVGRAG